MESFIILICLIIYLLILINLVLKLNIVRVADSYGCKCVGQFLRGTFYYKNGQFYIDAMYTYEVEDKLYYKKISIMKDEQLIPMEIYFSRLLYSRAVSEKEVKSLRNLLIFLIVFIPILLLLLMMMWLYI